MRRRALCAVGGGAGAGGAAPALAGSRPFDSHRAGGNWAKAGISLALRLGLSLIGGAIGAGVGADSCSQYVYDHEGCAIGYGVLGLIAAATTALIVDAAVLAREVMPAPAPARNDPLFVFTPLRSGGGLTLAGRF